MRDFPVTQRGVPVDLAYTYNDGTIVATNSVTILNAPGVLHSVGWISTTATAQVLVKDNATTMVGNVQSGVNVLFYFPDLDMQFLTSLVITNNGAGSTINYWVAYRANTILGPGLT